MVNERLTEAMIRARLKELGFYDDARVTVEEQQSSVNAIADRLRKASKRGTGNPGFPEFIITSLDAPDTVVVIEAKGQVSKHASADGDRPAEFALDGAVHYARHLADAYTVVLIAVSGDPRDSRWTLQLLPKGRQDPQPLIAAGGGQITALASMHDLLAAASFDPTVVRGRRDDLIAFSMSMHAFMRDEAELLEAEKPLVVAGSLLALSHTTFAMAYRAYSAQDLPEFWMESITKVMVAADLPTDKRATMTQPYTSIVVHPELGKPTPSYPNGLLREIVDRLAEHVMPYLTFYEDFDVVGQFYGEFLKYTGGDGKGLGIVLTPRHITELFAHLANVTVNDVVLDPCAGTGGFLISALKHAQARPGATSSAVDAFKRSGLIGIEQQATMYALAASNMILRGDGKANLHQGSCFGSAISAAVKDQKPTIGMLNPPYAKAKAGSSELDFVEHMLGLLAPGGMGIAIVPASCATSGSGRRRLLEKHTLDAVMSMPPELFYPVGVVTCIMVFTAHQPHAEADKKTWFGYWRDDWHVKVKNKGRVDTGRWDATRARWVEMFRNREVHAGESVLAKVTADDEWLAEAYMETDYSNLGEADFARVLLDYALFTLRGAAGTGASDGE